MTQHATILVTRCPVVVLTDLFHGEWMHHFTPIVRQFGGLFGTDDRDQPRSGYFSGIGREDTIHFLPNL